MILNGLRFAVLTKPALHRIVSIGVGFALCLFISDNYAQEINTNKSNHENNHEKPFQDPTDDSAVEEVEVYGTKEEPANQILGMPSDLVSGDELRMKLSSTLGETIANEPGVHNASFGPGVGLPVLRGMSGVRVRVSDSGIGAWDGAAISPDHASTVDAVLADRVEIVRGPATLKDGGSAIGGVVNVETNRIHKELLETSIVGSVESRYELVNHHQKTLAAKLDLQMDHVILHIDGFYREHGDVEIDGNAIDEQAVATQFFFDAAQDNTVDFIANTDAEATGGAVGITFVHDHGYFGFSANELRNDYGIPPGAHTEPEDAGPDHVHLNDGISQAPAIRIDLAQTRYDLKTGWKFDRGPLASIDVVVGDVDYEHTESELGTPGTHFESDVMETRVSVQHRPILGLTGEFGVHYVERFFAAAGRESFVPATDTDSRGVFLIERYERDRWGVEAGLRAERTHLEQLVPTAPLRPTLQQFMHEPIDYDLFSYSLGANYSPNSDHKLSLMIGRSARAPDIQELMALGPHLATRSYSIGSLIRGQQALEPETFDSVNLGWHHQGRLGALSIEIFYTQAEEFVFQTNTGVFFDLAEQFFRFNCARIEECLPVYEYTQADATLQGFEWSWHLPELNVGNGELEFELFGDFVRGQLDNGDDLPRMPPQRLGVRLNYRNGAWLSDLRITHAFAQKHPGLFETMTDEHTEFNGTLSYVLDGSTYGRFLFFLRGNNLLDEQIRNSSSFLRNFAPEPGRSLELGLRYDY